MAKNSERADLQRIRLVLTNGARFVITSAALEYYPKGGKKPTRVTWLAAHRLFEAMRNGEGKK